MLHYMLADLYDQLFMYTLGTTNRTFRTSPPSYTYDPVDMSSRFGSSYIINFI